MSIGELGMRKAMKNPRKINLIVVHCIGIRDVTALQCSEPLRNKDGEASKPSLGFAEGDRRAIAGDDLHIRNARLMFGVQYEHIFTIPLSLLYLVPSSCRWYQHPYQLTSDSGLSLRPCPAFLHHTFLPSGFSHYSPCPKTCHKP